MVRLLLVVIATALLCGGQASAREVKLAQAAAAADLRTGQFLVLMSAESAADFYKRRLAACVRLVDVRSAAIPTKVTLLKAVTPGHRREISLRIEGISESSSLVRYSTPGAAGAGDAKRHLFERWATGLEVCALAEIDLPER